MRAIDADELIEILRHNKEINTDIMKTETITVDIDEVIKCVKNRPTIDV